MSTPRLTYVVYAPSFSENNGGAIFMHELVRTLTELGERAVLWPMGPVYDLGVRGRMKRFFHPKPYVTAPGLEDQVARESDLDGGSVVVYPELVRGNPLKARNVVRWLLYKPGVLHPFEFGADELFFRVGEFCDVPEITGGAPDLLLWKINSVYRNENRSFRKGACFIVRKGREKPRIAETEAGAICIDGMSHKEINEVFNSCDTFYSYDEATMYSQYAAICGCVSVIIPGMYPSRAAWVESHELGRYGVAYGLNDIEHALMTRHLVHDLLRGEEEKGRETVRGFIALTRERFS